MPLDAAAHFLGLFTVLADRRYHHLRDVAREPQRLPLDPKPAIFRIAAGPMSLADKHAAVGVGFLPKETLC
jgi:hypothetical protein